MEASEARIIFKWTLFYASLLLSLNSVNPFTVSVVKSEKETIMFLFSDLVLLDAKLTFRTFYLLFTILSLNQLHDCIHKQTSHIYLLNTNA